MSGLPFAIAGPESPALTEIRAWIKRNRAILADRTPDEVSYLAVLCGFKLDDVCALLSNFHDAMAGSNIDNRLALTIFSRCYWMDHPEVLQKKSDYRRVLTLVPLWKSLIAYTVTGEEFKGA